ncbi:MAG TPA: tRNA (adenosine(37)-N6)-threonylcarbamoyltransferase complex transferase subunit TsaD [Candidatus Saccharimonadales bacterium]|nr:tRNA (adenosine(37)-N6)-threonylcarbamoyltransferase complex transferase subunit TsaD [Candidatus Saccharimonadales bacterium]
MYILGIETSCDETAASIIKADPKTGRLIVLANIISSQISIHQKYGGVVPEVAAREHVLNILPVIDEALLTAKISAKRLDLIAITKGPGLITSLITGMETVRALAFAWGKPVVEVNHISGHIYSNFISPETKINYPALILTVSGGHTNLVLMNKTKKIKIIGETLDDAAGEAYDKGAKMMGLGYPGGPIVSKYAAEYTQSNPELQTDIILPRPMLSANNLNFSFSGLKTALLYQLKKDKTWKGRIPEYCFAYQQAIIDVLVGKTLKAAKKTNAKTIMLSGGVSANKELRAQLKIKIGIELKKVNFLVPALEYTTDNAAMIAAAGFFNYLSNKTTNFAKLKVDPSLQLK